MKTNRSFWPFILFSQSEKKSKKNGLRKNPKSNFIISISGLIGSGKTTILDKLKQKYSFSFWWFFQNRIFGKPKIEFFPENVDNWNFLQPFYEDKKTYGLLFQLELLTRFQNLRDFGFVITERTPSDSRNIFTKCLVADGFISQDEWFLYEKAYKVQRIEPRVVIYLKVSPKVALQRIKKRQRPGEEGITLEYLEKLDLYSGQWLQELKQKGVVVHEIDASASKESVFKQVSYYVEYYSSNKNNSYLVK